MKAVIVLLLALMLTACPEKTEQKIEPAQEPVTKTTPKACTKELKICPDGSGVGRNGENNCEFDPCPEALVKKKGEPMMCTQEVKQCPDGTFVGRDSNNNCAFKPCPEEPGNLQ